MREVGVTEQVRSSRREVPRRRPVRGGVSRQAVRSCTWDGPSRADAAASPVPGRPAAEPAAGPIGAGPAGAGPAGVGQAGAGPTGAGPRGTGRSAPSAGRPPRSRACLTPPRHPAHRRRGPRHTRTERVLIGVAATLCSALVVVVLGLLADASAGPVDPAPAVTSPISATP